VSPSDLTLACVESLYFQKQLV